MLLTEMILCVEWGMQVKSFHQYINKRIYKGTSMCPRHSGSKQRTRGYPDLKKRQGLEFLYPKISVNLI